MSHVSAQAIGDICAHYADVVEGGTAWRGSGTSFRGIPGTYSNDAGLRSGDDTPLTSTGSAATTTFAVSGGSWNSSRWAKTDTPGFFAVCTAATNGGNVGAARRITGWNDTTKIFTVDAFPAATAVGDVFDIRQGFKRIPNGVDLEDEAAGGFDRFFHLSALAGEPLEYFGSGTITYRTTLELRLRLLKYSRVHDMVAAAMENLAILRPIICRGGLPDHRETTYTRALSPMSGASSVIVDDKNKVVVRDSYQLIYRIDTTFL